jgi:hypothetical protein
VNRGLAEIGVKATLSKILKSLPQGRAYAPVHSLVSRLLEDIKNIDALISRVECVTKSMGSCIQDVCKSGCAGIYLSRKNGEISVWKIGSNAFSLKRFPEGFKIASKDYEIVLEGKKLRVSIPSKGGKEIIEGVLDDPTSLVKNCDTLTYVLNKTEPLMKNALNNITRCIKERRLSC